MQMSYQLNRGVFDINISKSAMDPTLAFDIAERINPKRSFLFVSKILGRHVPTTPCLMNASYDSLAKLIPPDLPRPIVMIGMAETAVGLGAGVHRSYCNLNHDVQTNDEGPLYISTTRHRINRPIFLEFLEKHSHATRHLIYEPDDAIKIKSLREAKSIILIDDEATTGQTFINLYNALKNAGLNKIERLITCVLTDWSDQAIKQSIPLCTDQISLISGDYSYTPYNLPILQKEHEGEPSEPDPLQSSGNSRLGVWHNSTSLQKAPTVKENERIAVIGTGEFVWSPFLLAEHLEKQGATVTFSATSRSPINIGKAIKSKITFKDNYGFGINNFLYNVDPDNFDRIILCCETSRERLDPHLVSTLNAEVISYEK